jgi:hypothetical protein
MRQHEEFKRESREVVMKMPMSEFVLIVVGVAMFGILFLAEPCGGF